MRNESKTEPPLRKARMSVGLKIGILTSILHLCLVLLAFFAYVRYQSSTAGLVFVPFFALDAPIHALLLLFPHFTFGIVSPLILYGLCGSLMWLAIPWLTDRVLTRAFGNRRHAVKWGLVVATVPLLVAAFVLLSVLTTATLIREERPDELKKTLGSPSSAYLTASVVFEDGSLGNVTTITQMRPTADREARALLAFQRGVVILGEGYREEDRIGFGGRHFQTVAPVWRESDRSWQFICYRLFKDAVLLDAEGREMWSTPPSVEPGLSVDGVTHGDIDSDGRSEFVVYYPYSKGIALVDAKGETLWQHPVYALGHLEMADVRGNGRDEILYSNSNNAYLSTVFTTLDAEGETVSKLPVSTSSYEFDIVIWPEGGGRPNILLTEKNAIRIVDMEGATVIKLDAPGCRSFGKVEAVAVQFRGDMPAHLAVRKVLHPDLAVLYVYDSGGQLVFQESEVVRGTLIPVLHAVQTESGTEKLLVAAGGVRGARILEYSLTQ